VIGRDLLPVDTEVAPGATMTIALLLVVPFDAGRFTLRFAPARTAIEIDECHCNLPTPVRTIGEVTPESSPSASPVRQDADHRQS
jgi:hypothetical protein